MGSPAYITFRNTRFFGSLDGLRAISILGVIWVHATIVSPYYEQFHAMSIVSMGAFGVEMFFTISGFLIVTLLLREREKLGKISLRQFYVRRTLRIWPLYYGTLALYVALVLLMEKGNGRSAVFFHYLPGYLTFTYTWYPFHETSGAIFNFAWSLSVEEQFYMLFAPVVRFFRSPWPPVVIVGLIAARLSASSGLLARFVPANSVPWTMAANISTSICVGVLLAHALHSKAAFERLYPILGRKWAAPIALAVMIMTLASGPSWWLIQSCTLFAVIGSCVMREDNGLAPFLRLRAMAHIGVVSYAMYMLNTLVIDALRPLLARVGVTYPLWTMIPYVAATVAVATLSYRYFESPFLSLKDRFTRIDTVRKPQLAPAGEVVPET